MDTTDIKIEYWAAADIKIVYDLVCALAVFEKEPDAVTASIDDFQKAFTDGLIAGHIARDANREVAGMTLFYETFSTWKGKMLYLEDFFVLEKYRQIGIGRMLFDAYMKEAKKRHCSSLKWQVLDWNTSAIRFYEKYGAIVQKEWLTCRIFL